MTLLEFIMRLLQTISSWSADLPPLDAMGSILHLTATALTNFTDGASSVWDGWIHWMGLDEEIARCESLPVGNPVTDKGSFVIRHLIDWLWYAITGMDGSKWLGLSDMYRVCGEN